MNLIKASRFLSYVLRHNPQAAGICLDGHGWADVSELLRGMPPKFPLTRAQLEEIVRTDDKQRYAFSEDGTRIRANQGHSIPVDVELELLTPPQTLWHGTGEKYVASIDVRGLLPKSRLYVHLSADVDTAVRVGSRHGRPVVYRVDSGRMQADGYLFYRSRNGVWLTKQVPAEYLDRQPSPARL